MKRILTTLTLSSMMLFFYACSGEDTGEQTDNKDNVTSDTTSVDKDILQTEEIDTTATKDYVSEEDAMEELNKEHKQLTFCECVAKQKELDDAMETEEDDAKVMELLDEMERLVNEECKVLTVSPNRTPDERAAHKRKVQKCLQNL